MFHHHPLQDPAKEIRLIKFSPHPVEETISCTIENFEIATCLPYYALSYCWGPPKPTYSISIGTDGALMEIRENLHQCLQQLKRHTSYKQAYFWIDQISIDQENIPERNAQVLQMGKIYSSAQEIIIWLGAGDEDTKQAMEAIGSGSTFKGSSAEAKLQARKLLIDPYWNRLWIAQEVLLAKDINILCGSQQLSWALWSSFWPTLLLREGVPYLFELGELFYKGASEDEFKASKAAKEFIWRRSSGIQLANLPLWNALSSFSNGKCQDPRDKVFGLQGIVGEKEQVEVDYMKPLLDVYVDAVNISLETTPRIYLSQGIDPEFYAEMLYLGVMMGLFTTGEHVVSAANYFGRGLGRLVTSFGVNKCLQTELHGISDFAKKSLQELHKLHGVLAEGDIANIFKSVGRLQEKYNDTAN